ncbi:MAG: hypothetical protein HY462_00450 [Parcubacteria group bacterium]|nr:hypothetical protein [Parcubacteria group bacterium]
MITYTRYSIWTLALYSQKLLQILTLTAGIWLILGQVSAYAASITVSPPKFEFEVEKGGTVHGAIAITNGDSAPLVLLPSVADFTAQGEAGEPAFVQGSEASSFSLASWIVLPAEAITVPAGEKLEVPFTVRIPENAEAGGHFGTIFFSPVTEQSGTIAVEQKVGVLLLVRVAGEVLEQGEVTAFGAYPFGTEADLVALREPKSVFSNFPLTFAVRFTNTGNVHVKPQGTITLKNMFGTTLSRVGEEITQTETGAYTGTKLVDYLPINDRGGNVLPQSSRVFTASWRGYGSPALNEAGERELAWRGIGFGRYTAELDVAFGDNKLPKQSVSFWIIPWMIILPVLAGLALLIVLIKFFRTRSREKLKRELREELAEEQQDNHDATL